MQNRTFLVLLRPIFCEKLKIAPLPKENSPPKTFEFPNLAEKSVSISVKTFFFFFWRPPDFGLKKRLNFRAFRDIPSQFSDKPCETDSRTMKIWVKVVSTFLTLSKKSPPPFPNPGYAHAWHNLIFNIIFHSEVEYFSVTVCDGYIFWVNNFTGMYCH